MQLQEAHRYFGTDKFEGELFAEIAEHDDWLPLADFCKSGEPADDPEIEFQHLKHGPSLGGKVRGSFEIRFYEYVYRGCDDLATYDPIVGGIPFTLNINTGEIDWKKEPQSVREYDREEF